MSQHSPPTQDELADLGALALSRASALGASQAEADISVDTGLSATVRIGEVDTVEHQRDRGCGVTVYFGQRKGSASTADLSTTGIEACVSKACSIARHTAEDEYAGLADAELMARDIPDLSLHHPWGIDVSAAIELARVCEQAAFDSDPLIDNSEGATVSTHSGIRVYANSHGFCEGFPTSSHSVSCVVLATEGKDKQRDYWYATARDWHDLPEAELIGMEAARRALRRLGSRTIATGSRPVIFPAELARGLLAHFVGAIRGTSQYRQSSFLLGAKGERLFPEFVTMTEEPHLPRAMASAPFDDEGVATRSRVLVEQGELMGYVLSSYSARRLGLATTGNAGGLHNLEVSSDREDLEDLIGIMHNGFVVGELMGQGVNPVTGDYSRGASGFLVENGAIVAPVHEVTIAGNLREMYRRLIHIGADVDTRGTIRCGSILLDELIIAGESDAE